VTEIVNLNRVRKRRAAEASALQAAENRIRHGRTKAERMAVERVEAQRAKLLDNARILSPSPTDEEYGGQS
jgi:hypothetical protein